MTSKSRRSNRSPLAARAAFRPVRIGELSLLLALLALTLTLAPRAEAFVYWINSSGDAIGRSNLDGTGVDRSFITLAGKGDAIYAVAVDASHVYWADAAGEGFLGDGTIGRANLDGTGVDPSFISDAGYGRVNGVAVDPAHVYWAGGTSDTLSIGRANLDGTGVDQDFIAGPGALQVAVDSTHVYWADPDAGTIGRANLDGTGVDQDFITRTHPRQSIPTGVAVDDEHVYWTNFLDTIGRANLDGTGVDRSFITVAGNVNLSGVAVDDEHVYWGNQIGAKRGMIGRAKLNGKGADKRFIAGVDRPSGVAVDALRSFSFGKVKKNEKKGNREACGQGPRRWRGRPR